jgi:hypothetical protein
VSRVVGESLDERLVDQLAEGMSVLVTWIADGQPVSRVGRSAAGSPEVVTAEIVGEVPAGVQVSVHTLGPSICAIRGPVTRSDPAPGGRVISVDVEHVKDDRPPGLDVRPFRLLPAG